MIQDIYPSKLRNEYIKDAVAELNDTVVAFCDSKIMYKRSLDDTIVLPKVAEVGADKEYVYLFSLDDEKFFMLKGSVEALPGYDYEGVRELRKSGLGPKATIFALYTAKHLNDWYKDNSFCGRCGKKMLHSENERAMKCPECGNRSYPRIMPAVIVGVKNGDKLLLTKYKTGFAQYALVAGFTEIGETAEETVAREVMEEAGVRVKNIKYYKSQPWGIANDLLLGYFCEVDGDTTIHMDDNELKFAEWVNRENIELQSDDFSLTNEMMTMFKSGAER